ncbi:cupin domain-containing protein [Streptomyces morookaense]|uniref:Cupin domain-containing protein n=1 Tax=Streptomyces morookaense TaxID=1970 RepID=A0A7Y7B5A9_STRMO|nr:cupin domain-containing protein [Streptomyces morookaense]NVK79150.1 cupin domain-containing protein [Streptomyces morookaense]GHF28170.1 cupin [Streptomyces morookaense]
MAETPRAVALADVEPNRRRGGELRVVLGPKTAGATTGFMGVLTLQPGEFVSEHYHPYSEEFLYVVRGTATARLDGEEVSVSAGEGLLVPRSMRHRVENNGTETVEAVFHLGPLAPRPELGHVDTEPLPAPEEPQPQVGGAE